MEQATKQAATSTLSNTRVQNEPECIAKLEKRSSTRQTEGTTRGWYTVGLLTVACMLSLLDRMILSLMVGPIQRDLRITDTEFGLLQGFAFAIFYSIAGYPLGWLA